MFGMFGGYLSASQIKNIDENFKVIAEALDKLQKRLDVLENKDCNKIDD